MASPDDYEPAAGAGGYGSAGGDSARRGWRGRGRGRVRGRGQYRGGRGGRGGGAGGGTSRVIVQEAPCGVTERAPGEDGEYPFPSWRVFLPFVDGDSPRGGELVGVIQQVLQYFRGRGYREALLAMEHLAYPYRRPIQQSRAGAGGGVLSMECRSVYLSFNSIRRWPLPNIATLLQNAPDDTLGALSVALSEFVRELVDAKLAEQPEIDVRSAADRPVPVEGYFALRVTDFDVESQLRSIKSSSIGRLIGVRGTVIRVSTVKQLVRRMPFVCTKCSAVISRHFLDGRYSPPDKCVTKQCRSKVFLPVRTDADTVDWQNLRLQEIVSDKELDAGRMPRTIEVELTGDLVDSCVPGDVVMATGVVKVMSTDAAGGGGGGGGPRRAGRAVFLLYLRALHIASTRTQQAARRATATRPSSTAGATQSASVGASQAGGGGTSTGAAPGVDSEYSHRELRGIVRVASQPSLFRLLVNSICPSIYGSEVVKAGLLLTMFGGCRKFTADRSKLPVRGDPHILIVGDPGLGKSQLLQAITQIAPRGVYVSGNTTTSTGLTVTVTKDALSGDFVLEAGALVLGDQGVCCIDEFDKMGFEQQALLEAMEQQSISIAKAGISCTLSCRTSVIAAANPAGGHYNRAKTVQENIKLSGPVLSRFDLIFVLLDKPDERRDRLLSEHVMALHAGRVPQPAASDSHRQDPRYMPSQSTRAGEGCSDLGGAGFGDCERAEAAEPIDERLRWRDEAFDPVVYPLLRRYIAYAKQYCFPKLGQEASAMIQKFYLELRQRHHTSDGTPITTRQLESLLRLCEARARCELRDTVTAADAQDVIDIMRESLVDVYSDETGHIDVGRATGMSRSREVLVLARELHAMAERRQNSLFSLDEMYDAAVRVGIRLDTFRDVIDSLNLQNYLLKKGSRLYQLRTSAFGPSQR